MTSPRFGATATSKDAADLCRASFSVSYQVKKAIKELCSQGDINRCFHETAHCANGYVDLKNWTYSLAVSISDIKTIITQLFLLFCLYELFMNFWSSRKRPPSIVLTMGPLTRAFSCKRPALVTTTFSNSRGGHLRELRLYSSCHHTTAGEMGKRSQQWNKCCCF